jgi:signal transduction histidine kinase
MRRAVAIAFTAASLFALVVAVGLALEAGKGLFDALTWVPLTIACAVVGSVLWYRRAGGVLGCLFIFFGLALPIGDGVGAYSRVATAHDLPGAAWSAWFFQASLASSVSFFLILQLFPTGAPFSRQWRVLVWLTFVVAAGLFLVPALGPTPEFRANFPTVVHPLHVLSPATANTLDSWMGTLTTLVFGASAMEICLRYRRSAGDERAQLKWFAAAAAIAVVGFVAAFFVFPSGPAPAFALLAPLIPFAAGIAILKYHLYDIDVVISKAVVIALLAGFISLVYVAIVVLIGTLVGQASNNVLSLAATALIAVLFQPARQRATRLANRLVYGARATPYEVMAGFSARVADTFSTDDVLPGMAEAAGRGVGAAAASVRVVLPGGAERIERWTQDAAAGRVGQPWTISIAYQGDPVGVLEVSKSINDPLTPAEQRLLEDLGSQAGLALHNVRLTEELAIRLRELDVQAAALRVSRERLVTARDAQRRGLQRDLHEGPERQLINLDRKLIALAARDEPDLAEVDGLLDQANQTLDGLRDLARGIFPPLLADKGILAALEAHIRKVGANATIDAAPDVAAARFDADTEACVYFCCFQAIQNVIRHAGNAPSVVRVERYGGGLAFHIRDEGPGFDPTATPRGMGLQIVQDRVDALDGELTVTSAPGLGTTVAVRIPANEAVSA